jgi:hypothetical protein
MSYQRHGFFDTSFQFFAGITPHPSGFPLSYHPSDTLLLENSGFFKGQFCPEFAGAIA